MCDNIIVWNGAEIVGMFILCSIILIGGIGIGISYVKELIKERKRKKKNENRDV